MSKVDIDDLASQLRVTVTRLIKKLRKESATGSRLSLTERSTLALLDKAQLLPSELAAMEKITNQSMSQILSHLDELGYISRAVSETDKRKVLISLSAEGEKVLSQIRNERVEWLSHAIAATCTAEEQEILLKAIAPLTKLVETE
ncbi:MarR family transcriptional regulator [Mucilaginibacter terrenus]|uniref:MarR family transcriptional regulator n=1 Tax=Mucilaginibacter terrenus TaxID=2482727 RepID=A0A3E2NKM1_9SPHI|nr:MarR family transcriptional regulator [Mucilaginibacter terrenus]RFZ81450.1 MarR family transcriptional regulator [Mucilaginibacter terrenus]